jgi:hypothetical protein
MNIKAILITPIILALLVGSILLIPFLMMGLGMLLLGVIIYILIEDYLETKK